MIVADLGGGVIKQRIARPGQGQSGGFRTLIIFRSGEAAFFVHGFAKNEKDNIGKDELAALKRLASELLAYDDKAIARATFCGTFGGGHAMRKQYRSSLMASVHETAEGLYDASVMSKCTMRDFDELCLTPVLPLMSGEIREFRLREGASRAVFACYLNVTTGLVNQ